MRIARLINLIMLLLRTDHVAASELAQRFEVSKRTIYRDVETLNLAGIPIYATRGRNGGIGLMPNYKIDKKLLTADDIRNLRIALNSVRTLIENPELTATMQKIDALYAADNVTDTLLIDRPNWPGSTELKQLAERIDAAIAAHTYLTFAYSDRNGTYTTRKIEPYRLVYKGERWYVQAYSLERQAFRLFRLSRMQALTFLTTTFDPRPVPALNFDFNTRLQPALTTITLTADNLVRDQVVERFGPQVIQTQTKTKFTAQVALPNNESAYRFILSLGTHVQLLAGTAFSTDFTDYLHQLTSNYH
ncbi:helix-turn-helix transcriptional regulator [Lactiplantibacillus daowaiensis]|uniref:Helix-turn-helix transcriptional regulator n=1 Tax=Lactiplantibacillus daowaiensis TaxID=2559918 RepID=A0ABW1S3W9_9LACO|nr:YafY family protein [Lactiplantibacillus daowaiensis]